MLTFECCSRKEDGGQTRNTIPPSAQHHRACIWPSSGVEAGKTEYLCLLFHTGRPAKDGDPLCGISLPSAWIVSFTGERGRDERRRTHSSFKFYGSRCLQPQPSWHVTKCNMHTAAELAFWSWSPSFTHKLLSLPRFQPQTCLVPSLHPFPAGSTRRPYPFFCAFFFSFYNNTVCLPEVEQIDAAWQPLSLDLRASAVTSDWYYLPKAFVCFGLIMAYYCRTSCS